MRSLLSRTSSIRADCLGDRALKCPQRDCVVQFSQSEVKSVNTTVGWAFGFVQTAHERWILRLQTGNFLSDVRQHRRAMSSRHCPTCSERLKALLEARGKLSEPAIQLFSTASRARQ
jgi:hypothetical protein